jgi:hypothetical protein
MTLVCKYSLLFKPCPSITKQGTMSRNLDYIKKKSPLLIANGPLSKLQDALLLQLGYLSGEYIAVFCHETDNVSTRWQ